MKLLWTTIRARSLEESIAFYREAAGLKLLRRFPAGPGIEIAFLGNGEEGETLVELISGGSSGAPAIGDSVSLGFAVGSLEEAMASMAAKGIPLHGEPVETPSARFFCVKDPNGLSVQFFQAK